MKREENKETRGDIPYYVMFIMFSKGSWVVWLICWSKFENIREDNYFYCNLFLLNHQSITVSLSENRGKNL